MILIRMRISMLTSEWLSEGIKVLRFCKRKIDSIQMAKSHSNHDVLKKDRLNPNGKVKIMIRVLILTEKGS